MMPIIKNPLPVGAKQGMEPPTNKLHPHHSENLFYRKWPRKIFNRDALPAPIDYYRIHFPALPMHTDREWISVRCCFHDDKHPSLSLNLISGGFYCFACGAKGGDVVAFHMQRYGVPFAAAVTFMGAWIYEY
jgi:hypothetical protein